MEDTLSFRWCTGRKELKLTVEGKNILRVFGNKVQRIFGPKMEEVT
jgi:hypothetical protein